MKPHLNLPEDVRSDIADRLNNLLADLNVLYLKTRHCHWNVEGMNFLTLHQLFQTQYTELEPAIDDTAERIRALGHYAVGAEPSQMQSRTRLSLIFPQGGHATTMLQHLLADHEASVRHLRTDVDEIAQLGDAGTSDFLTGLMEAHEKTAWMLRAHLTE